MKFFGHLKTVVSHKNQVFILCCKAGIPFRGICHDLSKFSPSEFIAGVRYYQGGKKSPNEAERTKFGYSKAWLHHKGRNRHHFEYWTDYNPAKRKVQPVKMPLKYLVELICDRVAASKIYKKKDYTDSYPLEYFLGGKENRFIHEETSLFIENTLTQLSLEGEKKTFSYLKNLLKEKGKNDITY